VNTVSPGIIATPIWDVMMDRGPRPVLLRPRRGCRAKVGTPEDIARAVLFLIENRYATGSVVTVDGGYLVA
jgi:NAD(P)-dependent dehydrogenase (short-subunit alcohol dehydrogenase family)